MVALWLGAPALAVPPAEADLPAIEWSRFQLGNGLDVVLAPDDAATEVAVEWWVHAGARHEAPGRFGLAHLFEHATPFGQGFARADGGRELLAARRTDSNALTRFDYTRYFVAGEADALDLFLLAAADRLRADPTLELTTERVEAHRRNVAAEIERGSHGTWGWPVRFALQAGTFGPHHPYGHHVYGSDEETRAVSADDLLRWHRAHLRPEYTTLIVVGRFDRDAARASITRMFGTIPGGSRPPRAAPSPAVSASGAREVAIASEESHLFLGWPVPARSSGDDAMLTLLARVLSRRLESSAPAAVDEASAAVDSWELAGRFGISASFAAGGEAASIESWLRGELARLLDVGPSATELDTARRDEIAETREKLGQLGWQWSRAELLGEGVIYADDPDAFRVALERQREATPELVRAIGRTWLAEPGFRLLVRAVPSD